MTSSWTAPPRAQRSLSLNVAEKGTLNRIRSCVNVAPRLLVAQVTPPIISYQVVARAWHPLRLADGVSCRVPSTPIVRVQSTFAKCGWVGLREGCKWVLVQTGAHR